MLTGAKMFLVFLSCGGATTAEDRGLRRRSRRRQRVRRKFRHARMQIVRKDQLQIRGLFPLFSRLWAYLNDVIATLKD